MVSSAVIRVTLDSPIAFNHPPTLDAILGGILFARTYDGPEAAKCAPVSRLVIGDDAIPCASQIILVGSTERSSRSIIRSGLGHVMRDERMLDSISTFPRGKLGSARGTYANIANHYAVYDAASVAFLVRGDIEEIVGLLTAAGRIGTLTGKGYGVIGSVMAHKIAKDHERFGIVRSNGTPLRPIPVDAAHKAGAVPNTTVRKKLEFWQCPYVPAVAQANGIERRECIIPSMLPMQVSNFNKVMRIAA